MSTRRRIDWVAAKAAFIGDPTRSFSKVARQFKVSVPAVRKHSKAEGWEEAARRFDSEAEERAMRAQVKTRDRHVLDALRVRDLSFQQAVDRLTEGTLDVKLADLPPIGKYVELLTGEATDRTDIPQQEVREFFALFVHEVTPLIEQGRRGELLAILGRLQGQIAPGEDS